METPKRSLAKAIVWQVLGLISMTLIGWIVTGSAALAGGLALMNMSVGFVAYLLHERAWAHIPWGKVSVGLK
jgi:uncharacterized membrane protein